MKRKLIASHHVIKLDMGCGYYSGKKCNSDYDGSLKFPIKRTADAVTRLLISKGSYARVQHIEVYATDYPSLI